MNKINKDSGTLHIQLFFIILLILFAVIASAVSNSISKAEAKKIHDRFHSGYEDALALYEDGSYWDAIQRLKDVKTEAKQDEDDYQKYYCLTKLCNAKMDLKSRRYRSAYDELSGCHDTMPTELMDDYLALWDKVKSHGWRYAPGYAYPEADKSKPSSGSSDSKNFGSSDPWSAGSGYTYRSGNSPDDPYNAKDYIDPEDFYDENYDDFYDYGDAEDYWYEHN